jgi:hypothetical protein
MERLARAMLAGSETSPYPIALAWPHWDSAAHFSNGRTIEEARTNVREPIQ